jgi:hypothetical protein
MITKVSKGDWLKVRFTGDGAEQVVRVRSKVRGNAFGGSFGTTWTLDVYLGGGNFSRATRQANETWLLRNATVIVGPEGF